jgi:hypothetical protein
MSSCHCNDRCNFICAEIHLKCHLVKLMVTGNHKRSVVISLEKTKYSVSAFRTREDPQPTSEFVTACPCPDVLMQDGTQEGGLG